MVQEVHNVENPKVNWQIQCQHEKGQSFHGPGKLCSTDVVLYKLQGSDEWENKLPHTKKWSRIKRICDVNPSKVECQHAATFNLHILREY